MTLVNVDLYGSIAVDRQSPAAPGPTLADSGQRGLTDLLAAPAGLQVTGVTLEEALRRLYETARVPLIFSPTHLPSTLVTCSCQDVTVGEALQTLLDRTGLRVTVLENQVVVYPGEAPRTRASMGRVPGALAAALPSSTLGAFDFRTLEPLQQVTGVIRGVVRNQENGEPLAAAQVFIAELDQGVLTQSSGQYSMTNVPAGTHAVSVTLIGYRTATSSVTVASGATVVQDFFLQTEALALDEIVVTGTAGGSRIREVGNAVARLDASVASTQPIENVSDLLRGRVAGISIQQGSGGVGTASTIKIRGSSTMRLVNDGPLVYIDGVRVSNEMTSGPSDVSRIDDLDPASIESIEVIKGPAAATLYGTEAANGIIQIITKNGRPGAPQWDFTVRQGANWFADPAEHTPTNWGVNPLTGEVESLNILEDPAERDRMFRTGHDQYYGADVSGGSAEFRYYVSGSTSREQGATYNSEASKHNGRVNVTAQPAPSLTIAANAGFALTRLRLPSQFPYRDAVYATPAFLDGPRRGYRAAPPEARYEQDNDRNDANRITAGVTLTHNPADWLTHRLTFGLDMTDQTVTNLDNVLTPQSAQFFSARAASGSKSVTQQSQFFTTFDYSASVTRDLSESFASVSSAGFQVYTKTLRSVTASGTGFPSLGLTSVSATGERTSSDALVENNTAGVYAQQQFGYRDRLFVTGAVRADDNSAFGESFDLVIYPKVSASWVLSEEPFWGLDFMNAFRLRAAYGQSGQQPDAFDALRSYVTRADPDGTATLRPDTPGNPELGPERGVEIEAGFDAEFFDGRLVLDFTFYDERTKDAIVARNVAPSSGFTGQEFVNIGEVSNRGVELALGARVIDASSVDWDMDLNLSTNRNRVEELGLDGFLQLGWTSRHTEGYPVGSLWAPTVIQATLDSDGIVRNFQCDDGTGQPVACDEDSWIYQGHPDPTVEGSFSTSVTIGDQLTLSAMAQGKIGQSKYDLQAWYRYSAYQQTELNYFPERFDPRDVAAAQYGNSGEFSLWVNESSFIRFRELSLTYRVPNSLLARVGATSGSLSVAARNLGMIWTNWPTYPYHDPEVVDPTSTFSGNREPQSDASVPPLTSVAVTLRLSM
jgi:TonB-dependent SusC/RagA subfamily outer membrane receptor